MALLNFISITVVYFHLTLCPVNNLTEFPVFKSQILTVLSADPVAI